MISNLADRSPILLLSPHPDDVQLGAGGAISRFLQEKRRVLCVVFSACEASVPQGYDKDVLKIECRSSMAVLGLKSDKIKIFDYPVRKFPEYRQNILEDLIAIKNTYQPGLVLLPSSNDIHQDHTVIYWEGLRAFKKEASIWGYEHPWNNLTFTTGIFVKLNQANVDLKVAALNKFRSQADRSYMDENNVRALCRTRGSQLGALFAEAFELVRMIY